MAGSLLGTHHQLLQALTATGWATSCEEEGNKRQATSGFGGNGPVQEAVRVKVGAGDEAERRGREERL